jgi:hypothetical protein
VANTKDELAARRWFRQRLTEIGKKYPHLKTPARQQRLADVLDTQHTGVLTMGRKPTGNPRGRPAGSGNFLGEEQSRVSVRVPRELRDRLEAFAEGLHFTRGNPEFAGVVRAALEHYLVCPHRRVTQNVSPVMNYNTRQTDTGTAPSEQTTLAEPPARVPGMRQTRTRTKAVADDLLEDMLLNPEDISSQTEAEPAERDSIEWRRWWLMRQLQAAAAPLTAAALAERLAAVADEALGVSLGVVRADLNHWCKAGRVSRDESGAYVAAQR